MNRLNGRILVFAHGLVGRSCLEWLIKEKTQIVAVVTHQTDAPDSVIDFCKLHSLTVFAPKTPNTPNFIETLRAIKPDIILSFYYRLLICDEILAIPSLGAFNIHGSLLPHYRGCCPANWVLIHGESKSGATLHQMVAKADAGAIVGQAEFPISPYDNALDVTLRIKDAALILLDAYLESLLRQTAIFYPQDTSVATYFKRRTAADAQIDWSKSPWNIHNMIRSQSPFPEYFGASAVINNQQYTLIKSDILLEFIEKNSMDGLGEGYDCAPGTVLADLSPVKKRIACGINAQGKCCGFLDVTFLPLSSQERSCA